MNSGGQEQFSHLAKIPIVLHFFFFLHFLLFFPSGLGSVMLSLTSSCLDRLNNFGMISSQKLQN